MLLCLPTANANMGTTSIITFTCNPHNSNSPNVAMLASIGVNNVITVMLTQAHRLIRLFCPYCTTTHNSTNRNSKIAPMVKFRAL